MGIQVLSTDIEENGVRLKLNVVDTPGFGDFINNEDRYATATAEYFAWRTTLDFLVLNSI